MFIKVNESGVILNHWDHADEGLGITTEIPEPPSNEYGFPSLVNSSGDYKYKYVNNALVELSQQEIEAHPNYKARKINELKIAASQAIAALDELKAHSLMGKVAMGGELTQDEDTFVDSFLSQRQAILDQYELDKAQYE